MIKRRNSVAEKDSPQSHNHSSSWFLAIFHSCGRIFRCRVPSCRTAVAPYKLGNSYSSLEIEDSPFKQSFNLNREVRGSLERAESNLRQILIEFHSISQLSMLETKWLPWVDWSCDLVSITMLGTLSISTDVSIKPTSSPGSPRWSHRKMSAILPERLLYNTLQQRKSNGEILYYEIFKWKMKHAPGTIHRFCDNSLSDQERQSLTSWIRNLDDRSSCQRLQILFSFSVPCLHALEHILNLSTPTISAGAVSITKKGYH